jgi:dihydroorotase
MPNASRRDFLVTAGSFALAMGGSARAAMGPDDKFDLLIKGGDALDPSQSLRGRRDIGIRYGVIEAVEADIPASRALRVLDAGGKLVTPGLIDLHCHVFPYGSAIGIPADELVAHQCTTTCVSAGDAGANNFAAFRRYVVAQTRTRLYAFVHIANMGLAPFPVAELYNIDFAQVDTAAKAVGENADMVLGVRVRMSENVIAKHGLEPLKRAIAACERAGTGAKVMCHIGGVETRELMSQILDTLRSGDILTHAIPVRPISAGPLPTSCRTERCCRPRWRPSSAASSSTSATAAAASTIPSPSRRSPSAARPTPSPPTSTCSPAIRPACRI